ncbi:Transcription-repair-coupling factor, partial [Haemophilus influenzae]
IAFQNCKRTKTNSGKPCRRKSRYINWYP